jgi:hypothetical protein
MSNRFHFRFLIWIALLLPGPFCRAQSVTVRVIDIHNGRPLPKEKVSLALMYEKGQKTPAASGPNLSGETDASGEAHFRIAEPLPSHFSVMVHLTSEYLRCGCWVLGSTSDLLQKGIVGPPPSPRQEKSDATIKAAPGEVLVLTSPMPFLERLFYPIMKE